MKTNASFNLTPFFGAEGLNRIAELIEYVSEPMFISTDTEISPRTVNHWEKIGLLDNQRSEGQRWRRFSFVEFVWINILQELRKVGLGLDALKALKASLLHPVDIAIARDFLVNEEVREEVLNRASEEEKEEVSQFLQSEFWKAPSGNTDNQPKDLHPLTFLISEAVHKKIPVSLLVFPNGDYLPWVHVPDYPLLDVIHESLATHTLISVSVSGIIREFLSSELAPSRIGRLHILQPDEEKLLQTLHSGDYQSVKIHFKDNKMKQLEMVRSQEVTRKIVDILSDSSYQNISIKTHNGKITHIENTLKVQL